MTLAETVRSWKTAGVLPTSAIDRLAARLEKRALDYGELAASAGGGALEGSVSGGISGAMLGMFNGPEQGLFSKPGVKNIAHKGLIGAVVGAVPFAMHKTYQNYRQQKAREKALADYNAHGGWAGGGAGAQPAGQLQHYSANPAPR